MNSKHYSDHYTQNYIKGNVYAITGAGSGFGRETALEIIKMGGCVVISDIIEERINETVKMIEELGCGNQVAALVGDVSKYEDNVAMVNLAVEKFGKLDAFYANAGIMPLAVFEDHDVALSAWDKCIDLNLRGVLYGICASYDTFKAQGYGHFVAASSIHGNYPTSGSAVYAAVKQGVRYLMHTLGVESAGMIKTSYICPPGVPTNLASTIVKTSEKSGGIWGHNKARMGQEMQMVASGEHPEFTDINSIKYNTMSLEELVWGIMFILNQPRGVNVSAITMHPSNDFAIL